MKKRHEKGDLRREYDAALIRQGTRGKYAARYKAGVNIVLLAPDVAAAFPSQQAVNEALRLLLKIAQRTPVSGKRNQK